MTHRQPKQPRSRQLLLCMIIILCVLLSACGKKEEINNEAESSPSPEPAVIVTPEPTPEPTPEGPPIITEREVVNGKMQSYLTGEWKDEKVTNRRPIAVMVPNNKPAMPQYGISLASIIYEAPVEGRITRLMPIFEDFDELEYIGPVRSSRDYYVYVAAGYEAIYCNWGLAVPYVEELINSDAIDNISAAVAGIHNPSDAAFGRISRPGYSTEYTGYVIIEGLMKSVEKQEYDWDYSNDFVPQFTFINDDNYAEDEYKNHKTATMIYPGGESGSNSGGYGAYHPYFEYNKEDRLYYRYQSGNPQVDEYNNEQLTVSNVIFQYCHGEVRDSHDYLAFGVHGEGEAIVFTGGKVIKGKWMRYDGDGTPAKFYDENDEEIIFNQGKTWICNIWDEYGEFAVYE